MSSPDWMAKMSSNLQNHLEYLKINFAFYETLCETTLENYNYFQLTKPTQFDNYNCGVHGIIFALMYIYEGIDPNIPIRDIDKKDVHLFRNVINHLCMPERRA